MTARTNAVGAGRPGAASSERSLTTLADVSRREQILSVAAELFAERGFHGVSVAELGTACGISGPALYRHFASKDAMLAEMLVSISEELLGVGRRRVAEAVGPREALHALVDWHVDFALHNKALIVVQDRDWASLPSEAREQVRALQRRYVELWVAQLRGVHAELSPKRARAMAHAAFGLINSTPHSAMLSEPEMASVLEQMALRALDVPRGGAASPWDVAQPAHPTAGSPRDVLLQRGML
jgi:AcrR family transcriptional regulator